MSYNGRGGYQRGGYQKRTWTPPPKDRRRIQNASEYQQAIFAAVQEAGQQVLNNFRLGVRSVVGIHVDALAGCGKTSTSVEKDYFLPAELLRAIQGNFGDVISVAFNADIAKVLQTRVADGVEGLTIHALGRRALVERFPRLKRKEALDTRKYLGYIEAEVGDEPETMVLRENLRLMMDRARDQLAFTAEAMLPILDQFNMETGDLNDEEFCKLACKILHAGLRDTDRMDFGDMIAMPVYHNLPMRRYAVVSVDEYQDLCPAQHELLDRSVKPGGLMFTVGDSNQAIYLWRGADSESIDRGVARYNSKRYILPRTYRCGKAIVAYAQRYVPEFECPETAHQGEVVEDMSIEQMLHEAKPGSFILSRLNAPLLTLCFSLIRLGIPANIKGRDVGEHLKYMVKRSKAETVDDLLGWVNEWEHSQCDRLQKRNKPTQSVTDTAACIRTLCEGRYTIADVRKAIDVAFPEKCGDNIVTLMSIHKSKGLEAKIVYVLESTMFLPKGNPREEQNLAWVACTRAMDRLCMVQGRPNNGE
jgi:superfamily I DNA/RNA helicase